MVGIKAGNLEGGSEGGSVCGQMMKTNIMTKNLPVPHPAAAKLHLEAGTFNFW